MPTGRTPRPCAGSPISLGDCAGLRCPSSSRRGTWSRAPTWTCSAGSCRRPAPACWTPRRSARQRRGCGSTRAFGATPSIAFARACHQAAGANPFLLGELAAALREEGLQPDDAAVLRVERVAPATIGQSVLTRIARLGTDAITEAVTVAILYADSRLDLVTALADLPLGRTVEATDPAHARRHPDVRTSVVLRAPGPGQSDLRADPSRSARDRPRSRRDAPDRARGRVRASGEPSAAGAPARRRGGGRHPARGRAIRVRAWSARVGCAIAAPGARRASGGSPGGPDRACSGGGNGARPRRPGDGTRSGERGAHADRTGARRSGRRRHDAQLGARARGPQGVGGDRTRSSPKSTIGRRWTSFERCR